MQKAFQDHYYDYALDLEYEWRRFEKLRFPHFNYDLEFLIEIFVWCWIPVKRGSMPKSGIGRAGQIRKRVKQHVFPTNESWIHLDELPSKLATLKLHCWPKPREAPSCLPRGFQVAFVRASGNCRDVVRALSFRQQMVVLLHQHHYNTSTPFINQRTTFHMSAIKQIN